MLDPTEIDLGSEAFWQDPYPALRAAREAGRFGRTPHGELVLLAADDVDLVQSSPDFEQLGLLALERLGVNDGPFYRWRALTMAASDGAFHERLRASVARGFTPRRVERLRALTAARAREELERLAAGGVPFDIVTNFAHDLPLWLICEFLGLPQTSRGEIDGLISGTEEMFTDPLTTNTRSRAEQGVTALCAYVERLFDERRQQPQDDLVTDLVEAQRDQRLSHDEANALVVNIIGGAVGSSRAAIANSLLELLRHPEQRAYLMADRARLGPAVEECLRYHPPFRGGRRLVRSSNSQLGVALDAGDTVFIARQAANRDPSHWADADTFDVRREPARHYSFGYGAHFCLGQALARLDVQEAVWAFFEVLPRAELLTRQPQRVPFTPDEQLRELRVIRTI
jgi:cytochrome P450